MILAVLELACGGLLLAAARMPELEKLGLYLLVLISCIALVHVFLLMPISFALSETLSGSSMVWYALSAVYGTVTDIYFAFIVWSHIRRNNDDGAALAHATLRGHPGQLAKPR